MSNVYIHTYTYIDIHREKEWAQKSPHITCVILGKFHFPFYIFCILQVVKPLLGEPVQHQGWGRDARRPLKLPHEVVLDTGVLPGEGMRAFGPWSMKLNIRAAKRQGGADRTRRGCVCLCGGALEYYTARKRNQGSHKTRRTLAFYSICVFF